MNSPLLSLIYVFLSIVFISVSVIMRLMKGKCKFFIFISVNYVINVILELFSSNFNENLYNEIQIHFLQVKLSNNTPIWSISGFLNQEHWYKGKSGMFCDLCLSAFQKLAHTFLDLCWPPSPSHIFQIFPIRKTTKLPLYQTFF